MTILLLNLLNRFNKLSKIYPQVAGNKEFYILLNRFNR